MWRVWARGLLMIDIKKRNAEHSMQTNICTMKWFRWCCIFARKRFDWSWHWGKSKKHPSQNKTVDTVEWTHDGMMHRGIWGYLGCMDLFQNGGWRWWRNNSNGRILNGLPETSGSSSSSGRGFARVLEMWGSLNFTGIVTGGLTDFILVFNILQHLKKEADVQTVFGTFTHVKFQKRQEQFCSFSIIRAMMTGFFVLFRSVPGRSHFWWDIWIQQGLTWNTSAGSGTFEQFEINPVAWWYYRGFSCYPFPFRPPLAHNLRWVALYMTSSGW